MYQNWYVLYYYKVTGTTKIRPNNELIVEFLLFQHIMQKITLHKLILHLSVFQNAYFLYQM